ncbi:phage Gp37/Gp68 family protein [Thalassospira lucentensis]|uniref:phage Gp37/Gp68 family protein n=1 Tax=Thalassospira lucentensis TaxID=168935 RepID=UPI003D2683DC
MTKIEWTKRPGTIGVSWNPLRVRNLETGGIGHFCEKVSAGCKNCYAETFQKRFQNPIRYAAQDADQVEVFLDEKTLLEPLKWKKPRTAFVCSQTDIFLRHYSDEMICKVFAVMALCPLDTLIVLTKRPERAKLFLQSEQMQEQIGQMMREIDPGATCYDCPDLDGIWPLRNVWLGTSVEDQATANERIPLLLQTPASLRFISAEPLLGPIDLNDIVTEMSDGTTDHFDALDHIEAAMFKDDPNGLPALDWVIAGGESGNNARPMHPAWDRSLRDQCNTAGVPFFLKQRGSTAPLSKSLPVSESSTELTVWPDGTTGKGRAEDHGGEGQIFYRTTKKAAGRLLDGVEHTAWPGDAA